MFTSATPAKRVHTRASAASRRSQSRAGSVVADEEVPAGPSRTTISRRAGRGTSIARSVASSVADSTQQGLDDTVVDQDDADSLEDRGILLKTPTHAVRTFGSKLPVEVQQILAQNDFYTEPFAARLDSITGYACLSGRHHCYVWNFVRSTKFSPTCYTFPVPQSDTMSLSAAMFSPVPFTAFVPQGAARDPGFLLIASTGQIRFWSSLSSALSSIDKCAASDLSLEQGEVVRDMDTIETKRFAIATSGNRVFSLRLDETAGQPQFRVNALSRSRGVLARVGGLFGNASADPRDGILGLTHTIAESHNGKRAERAYNLYAVSDRSLVHWQLTATGGEIFIAENEIYHTVAAALDASLAENAVSSGSGLPDIIQAKAQGDSIVLLVSYASSTTSVAAASQRHYLSYAMIVLSRGGVEDVLLLSHRQEPDPRPLSTPKLLLSSSGDIAFIVFGNVVVMTSLTSSLRFEESISLKNAVQDRFLGGSLLSPSDCFLFSGSSGILQLDIDMTALKARAKPQSAFENVSAASLELKSRLDQAIIFGNRKLNPLAFDLTSDLSGDVVVAAEAVSKELLASASPHLPKIIDLRAQLADRAARLRLLIIFLNDNSLMGKLSKTAKHHLLWDAEKMAVAITLWQIHGSHLSSDQDCVIAESIEKIDGSSSFSDDATRSFFRQQIDRLRIVLEAVGSRSTLGDDAGADLQAITDRMLQVAEVLTLAYKTITRFRQENNVIYGTGTDQTCLTEPWSSAGNLTTLSRKTFEGVMALIEQRSTRLGTAIDNETSTGASRSSASAEVQQQQDQQHLLKNYAADLADVTLAMHQERMAYLESSQAGGAAAIATELRELVETYMQLRPHIVRSLVRVNRVNAAYDIAERYRDFQSLVQLCHDPSFGQPLRNQYFIEKYKEEYAYALYDWCIETGRLHALMTQDKVYAHMLASFLKLRKLHRLSWLQDIADERFAETSQALLSEANVEIKLAEQKLMLSLGKLACIASLRRDELETAGRTQDVLQSIDDRIDIAASHDRLVSYCTAIFDVRDNIRSAAYRANKATEVLSSVTGPQQQLVSTLFNHLLSGKSLSQEDLVDLFTLKRNDSDEQRADSAYAIDVLMRDRQTPPARRHLALKQIWQRVYLHDDWSSLRTLARSAPDNIVADAIRKTALHHTLLELQTRGSNVEYVLRPNEALSTFPGEDEQAYRARFSNASDPQRYSSLSIDGLVNQTMTQNAEVKRLVESDSIRLEEFFDEVQRLVAAGSDT